MFFLRFCYIKKEFEHLQTNNRDEKFQRIGFNDFKKCQLLFILLLVSLISFSAVSQSHLEMSVYASSNYSEQALSWFMDNSDVSGSQVAIQVIDYASRDFVENCSIYLTAFQMGIRETKVNLMPSDFTEVKPGLYILHKRGGLFNAVFNKSGVIQLDVTVKKAGYPEVSNSFVFFNKDFVNGYSTPLEGYILSPPQYLFANENDPQYITLYNQEKYYSVLIDFIDPTGNLSYLIVPVNMKTHCIPSDWETYQNVTKGLVIANQYRLLNPDKLSGMLDDVVSLKKQLPVAVGSGKIIDILSPVLQSLVKTAVTGGSSAFYDVSAALSRETAKILLSNASSVTNYSDLFLYNKIQANLSHVEDSLKVLLVISKSLQVNQIPKDAVAWAQIYSKWVYVLKTIAFTTDFAVNKFMAESAGRRLLEAQVNSILSSQMPDQMKFAQLGRYLQNNQRNFLRSLKKSEKVIQALHSSFDIYWDESGNAKAFFDKFSGESIKKTHNIHLPSISNLKCLKKNHLNVLNWKVPNISYKDVGYVIKYNDQPITEQNWGSSYTLMITNNLRPQNGSCEINLINERFSNANFHFAIKYFLDDKIPSPISVTYCESKVKSSSSHGELFDMVYIEGGCLHIGTALPGYENASPAHEICLDDFYMSKTPVTQNQWVEIMGNNPSRFNGCDNCPVENVSWSDVQRFLENLNKKTGKNYRLPTEAEWEYAAWGGKKRLSNASHISYSVQNKSWYSGNSNERTHPVGKKQPNLLGLNDMLGNVFEWCSDWYSAEYYAISPRNNPTGPINGNMKVIRGGAWTSSEKYIHNSYRAALPPGQRSDNCGFRICLSKD
jgi:formylglycine-generating enzyme required for sulfatase activity